MKFYHFLKKNPELNERITEARKNGVQTLIDKLLQVFQYQEIENPNQILWIREKTKFITFLANKLTDLYSDNKVQNVKTDQSIKISWEDNQEDLIDLDLHQELHPIWILFFHLEEQFEQQSKRLMMVVTSLL